MNKKERANYKGILKITGLNVQKDRGKNCQ